MALQGCKHLLLVGQLFLPHFYSVALTACFSPAAGKLQKDFVSFFQTRCRSMSLRHWETAIVQVRQGEAGAASFI